MYAREEDSGDLASIICVTAVSEDRMAAAGAMLTAIFSHAADRSGLKAD
jgi:hypothetical protein